MENEVVDAPDEPKGSVAEGVRVLIVEDDTPTRQMLVQFLTDEGFDVVPAQDGAHALRLAAAADPRVIVLDLGLPELDGTAFAERWHARAEPDVPIVVISGLPYGRAMSERIGALAFFEKPFAPDALADTLRAIASRGNTAEVRRKGHASSTRPSSRSSR